MYESDWLDRILVLGLVHTLCGEWHFFLNWINNKDCWGSLRKQLCLFCTATQPSGTTQWAAVKCRHASFHNSTQVGAPCHRAAVQRHELSVTLCASNKEKKKKKRKLMSYKHVHPTVPSPQPTDSCLQKGICYLSMPRERAYCMHFHDPLPEFPPPPNKTHGALGKIRFFWLE